jgi:hypothetical protein
MMDLSHSGAGGWCSRMVVKQVKAEKEAWEFLARCDLAGTMAVSPIAASAYAGIRPTLKTMKATTGLAQTDRRATRNIFGDAGKATS